jgi:hypothetical protein
MLNLINDLTEEKQKEVIEAYGEDNNFDTFPVTIIEVFDVEE